jgi:precorrin-6B methylase 2
MLEDKDFIKSCDVPGPTKEAIRAIIVTNPKSHLPTRLSTADAEPEV